MALTDLGSHLYCNLPLADETPRCAPAIPSSDSVFTGPANLNFNYNKIHKMHFLVSYANNREMIFI